MRVSSSVDAVEIGKKVICRDCQLFIIYNWQLVNGSITFNLDVLSLSSIIQFDGVYHNPADLQHLSQKNLVHIAFIVSWIYFPADFQFVHFFVSFFFFITDQWIHWKICRSHLYLDFWDELVDLSYFNIKIS